MEQQHIGILRLIKSALTGQPQPLPEGFDLADAYVLVREHQLQPMVYEGAAVCGFSRQLPVMKQLFQDYCRALIYSEGQMKAVDELRAAFEQAGVDYLFFKGSRLKNLYPKPELRPMGDADVLVRTQQQEQVNEVLRALGYELKAENEQEYLWLSPRLAVEPHKSLIDAGDERFYSYFGGGWQLAKRDEAGKAYLTSEDEFAFLFVHMTKHYRGGGIGLRQFIDLWLYRRAVPELDEEKLQDIIRRLGLTEFYQNVLRTLSVWFEEETPDEKTCLITRFVFNSGSFGTEDAKFLSRTLRAARGSNTTRAAIVQKLFPPLSRMRLFYPVLRRVPVLLPVLWVVRLVSIALFRRDKLRKGREDLRLVRDGAAEQFEQSLHFVGLDIPR